jgi:hypothetical protein
MQILFLTAETLLNDYGINNARTEAEASFALRQS